MLKAFKKLWNDERGNVLIIGGAALPMLVGAAGLANDTIQWALWKRQLQRAADSAAIAGVYDRVQAGNTEGVEDVVNHDLELNQHSGIDLVAGFPEVEFPADNGDLTDQVQVTLAVRKALSFSSLFMDQPPTITASATAASTPGTDDFCVISLEDTTKTGIDASGSSEIIMDCGMITNSVAANAAAAGGNGSVTATVIAAAGGIQQSNNWNVGKYDPYVPAQDDPYAELEPSDTEKSVCTNSSLGALNVDGGNSGGTIDGDGFPNNTVCLSSISVGSNRTYTLRDGVFLIDGGGINIQGTLNVINATLVLTNDSAASNATIGTFDMNAQAVLNVTPPDGSGGAWSEKWSGMAIYQDRRAVDNSPTGQISSNSPNKINGGSAGNIKGVLYFPKQQLTYNGGGNTNATCTQFVIKRIVFTGNNGTNITSDEDICGDDGIEPVVGGRKVRLVA